MFTGLGMSLLILALAFNAVRSKDYKTAYFCFFISGCCMGLFLAELILFIINKIKK